MGDTFDSIAARYDTCLEAIIWENELVRAGLYSSQFIIKEGTPLSISPRTTCDNLPEGEYVHTVTEGDTLWDIIVRYCSYTDGDWHTDLEPGDQMTIQQVENAYTIQHDPRTTYWCSGSDVLVIYDDNDRIFASSFRYPAKEIAVCYGVTTDAIIEANPEEYRSGSDYTFINQHRSYVIPDVKRECMLSKGLIKREHYRSHEPVACYPHLLHEIVELAPTTSITASYQDKNGLYCYTLADAYTILLEPLQLDWFRTAPGITRNLAEDKFNTRGWQNVARCIGVSIEEIKKLNDFPPYTPEILPPNAAAKRQCCGVV
ncbi:MAG: LysM peptidoglycan-binding domain-containing protein, partial [Aggregatilineales bacterium]